jgi:hypothetical protein
MFLSPKRLIIPQISTCRPINVCFLHASYTLCRLTDPSDFLSVIMFASCPPGLSTLEEPVALPTAFQQPHPVQTHTPASNQSLEQFTANDQAWTYVSTSERSDSSQSSTAKNNIYPEPTQLPFYSSELGRLPIHPNNNMHPFNQPIGEQLGETFPGHSYSSAEGSLPSSSPSDIHQYFSLFDDNVGNPTSPLTHSDHSTCTLYS